jgi:hypothetical protein
VLALARLLAAALERIRIAPLVPLLAVQLALLSAFLAVCMTAGAQVELNSASMIIAAMLESPPWPCRTPLWCSH